MTSRVREKFATKINSKILSAVRSLAKSEGRQIQSLIEEALADLIEKRKRGRSRSHVMEAYLRSHETFGPLYKKLAE